MTEYRIVERPGYVDIYYTNGYRASFIIGRTVEPAHTAEEHECGEGCDHSAEPTIIPTKVHLRYGIHTTFVEAPEGATKEQFAEIFTCPVSEVATFLVTGTDEQKWFAQLREDNFGGLDPVKAS